jgi:MFS family permease
VVAALMAAGGPASTIGFSLARDYNAGTAVGTATGVVNVGGFSAVILASLLVGGILDLAGRSDVPAYRMAFGCAVAVQLLGTVMAVRWWLRVRGLLLGAQSRGEPVPVRVVEHHFDRRHLDWNHGAQRHGSHRHRDRHHGDQRQAGAGQVRAG